MSVFESQVENYELPDSWGSGRLDEVCDQMKQGKILPQKEIHQIGRYPVFGANGCIGYCDSYFLEEERILITCRGSTCGMINRSPEKSFVTNNAMILFEKDCLNKDFLFFALQEFSTKGLKTGSGQPQLTKGILNSHVLPLPPLPEQKKIAHVLSTVQRAIEAQERIIQTTTELKKTLMHKLFTEGLRNEPQKQTEIGPIPESWGVVSFEKFVVLQRGYDLRKQDFRDGTVPVIGATQIIGHHDTAIVKGPGVTVVRSGSSAGKPLFISEDFWPHNVVLFVRDFRGNVPKFVYYKIQSLDLTRYRQGVAVPTLNRNTFRSIQTALPPREEQEQIADTLDSVETKSQVAVRKKTALQELFHTLLHELMTAKVRVHNLKLELVS